MPVSYTHLDVYKRQVLIHLDIGTVVEHVKGTIDIDFQRSCDILCLRFRLDVYKRQDCACFRAFDDTGIGIVGIFVLRHIRVRCV